MLNIDKIKALSKNFPECYIILSSSLASVGKLEELKIVFTEALNNNVPIDILQEAMMQILIFAGYPRTINAFHILKKQCDELGIDYKSSQYNEALYKKPNELREKGLSLFKMIYTDLTDTVINKISATSDELVEWILSHAYGNFLSRDKFTLRERELIATGILISLELSRQISPHVRGIQHSGGTMEDIDNLFNTMEIIWEKTYIDKVRKSTYLFLNMHDK